MKHFKNLDWRNGLSPFVAPGSEDEIEALVHAAKLRGDHHILRDIKFLRRRPDRPAVPRRQAVIGFARAIGA